MCPCLQVPDPCAAALPTGRLGEGERVVPEPEVVMAAAELSKKRLHSLSQPHWGGQLCTVANSLRPLVACCCLKYCPQK